MEEATGEKIATDKANANMRVDTERADEQPLSRSALLPYTYWERFVESFVHPICALLLCVFTFGIVFLGLHVVWISAYHQDYKTLVPAAFFYNKSIHLAEDTKFKFNIRALGLSMGFGGAGIFVALGALFLAHLTWTIPPERLFQHPLPLAKYMKHLSNLAMYQLASGLVLCIYLSFFYDLEPENGSGCYTYTNSKGRLVAKCSIESAACYTKGWPVSIKTGHAARLCTETRVIGWMATAIVPCAAALLLVYQHMETLSLRYTTPEQRLEMAEREREEEERQKVTERENYKKNKWYYVAWGVFSVACTLWNIRTIVKED